MSTALHKRGRVPLEGTNIVLKDSVPVSRRRNHIPLMGFTLIETLVAITVLLLVVIGPITVAQRGIKSAYYANEQVTAVFLAQEAVEAIRQQRDEDALDVYNDNAGGTWDWYGSLPGACTVSPAQMGGSGGCAFDTTNGTFETCGVGNYDCELNVNETTGVYSYEAGGQSSGFTRKVYVGDTVSNGGVPVRVDVTWTSRTFSGGTPRTVTLETWVYDHYERYETF